MLINQAAVDEMIVAAMRPICPEVWKNVCRADPLPEEFIVHDSTGDTPELYAGDFDVGLAYMRRVHLYTKWSPTEKVSRIRKALRAKGFTITDTDEMDDSQGFTHSIVSAYILGNNDELED